MENTWRHATARLPVDGRRWHRDEANARGAGGSERKGVGSSRKIRIRYDARFVLLDYFTYIALKSSEIT